MVSCSFLYAVLKTTFLCVSNTFLSAVRSMLRMNVQRANVLLNETEVKMSILLALFCFGFFSLLSSPIDVSTFMP